MLKFILIIFKINIFEEIFNVTFQNKPLFHDTLSIFYSYNVLYKKSKKTIEQKKWERICLKIKKQAVHSTACPYKNLC